MPGAFGQTDGCIIQLLCQLTGKTRWRQCVWPGIRRSRPWSRLFLPFHHIFKDMQVRHFLIIALTFLSFRYTMEALRCQLQGTNLRFVRRQNTVDDRDGAQVACKQLYVCDGEVARFQVLS